MTRLVLLLTAIGVSAASTGFALHDLTKLPIDVSGTLGGGYETRAEPARALMVCSGCAGTPIIDIRLGRQDDGTEARIRAGTTTASTLEGLCRQRDPACRIESVSVAPAVGWMSSYTLGTQSAHTVIVLRDGDMLTVRTIASDAAVARRTADLLVSTLVPVIVGQ